MDLDTYGVIKVYIVCSASTALEFSSDFDYILDDTG